MKCGSCNHKMVKVKYFTYDDLVDYLNIKFEENEVEDYHKWLNSIKENDLILTSFTRNEFGDIRTKHYLRVVEKIKRTGIKLKKLTKTFKYDTGELVYGTDGEFSIKTTYKILPIDRKIDKIIREYSKNKDEFDIEILNKLISNELLEKC